MRTGLQRAVCLPRIGRRLPRALYRACLKPLQVLGGLEVVETTFGMPARHHVVVVAEHLDPVATDTPLRVAATTRLDDVPERSVDA